MVIYEDEDFILNFGFFSISVYDKERGIKKKLDSVEKGFLMDFDNALKKYGVKPISAGLEKHHKSVNSIYEMFCEMVFNRDQPYTTIFFQDARTDLYAKECAEEIKKEQNAGEIYLL